MIDNLKFGKREKTHRCIECRKRFVSERQLRIHLLAKHEEIMAKHRPFICDVCTKPFQLKCKLEAHKLIHTGEKPNKCSLCDRAFIHLSSLKRHTKMHTGGKPYACKCIAGFTTQGELMTHKATCVTPYSQDKPSTSGSGR